MTVQTEANAQSDPSSPVAVPRTAIRLCRDDNARQAVAYQIGRRGLREGQSSGDDEDVILLLTDTNLRTHKTHHTQITRGSCV